MPIKPENKKLYPENWREISESVKESQGHRCAFCGIPDKMIVFRGWYHTESNERIEVYQDSFGNIYNAANSDFLEQDYFAEISPKSGNPLQKAIKIVLTTAHLDHDPTNNAPENLKALCQRCHNRYDAKHRAETRKKTKNNKQIELL